MVRHQSRDPFAVDPAMADELVRDGVKRATMPSKKVADVGVCLSQQGTHLGRQRRIARERSRQVGDVGHAAPKRVESLAKTKARDHSRGEQGRGGQVARRWSARACGDGAEHYLLGRSSGEMAHQHATEVSEVARTSPPLRHDRSGRVTLAAKRGGQPQSGV